jgi:hypothetical protein
MTTHCFVPILGKKMRVTELDDCGTPVPGTGMQVATDGFITVSLSSEVEDGAEIIVKKASGALCVNEKLSDSFKRFTVEVEFCGVNPSLLAITSNAEPYEDYEGDVAGFTVPEGEINKNFALEVWTGLSGQACVPGQSGEASGYLLLPFIRAGVLGDIEISGEDAITFSLTGSSTRGGNNWDVGPYKVVMDDSVPAVPAPLPTALDPFDHLLLIDTALAPPADACEPALIPVTPTSVTAGAPGTFEPLGATVPADLAALIALGDLGETTTWSGGDYLTLGDTTDAHWDGTTWVAGMAP